MSKFYKVMGILAGLLLIIGIIFMFVASLFGVEPNTKLFDKLNINIGFSEMNELKYTEIDSFTDIEVDVNKGSVKIVPGDEYAIAYQTDSDKLEWSDKEGTLKIEDQDTSTGFNLDFFNFQRSEVEYIIYIPMDSELDNIEIQTNFGSIEMESLQADQMNLSTNMGEIALISVTVGDLYASTDMGEVNTSGKFTGATTLKSEMGSVNLEGYLENDLIATTDMGNVYVITYYSKDSYDYTLTTDLGDETVNNTGGLDLPEEYNITLESDMGDCTLTFSDEK